MFVTVKYADNQAMIFNSNCKNCVLLCHIREKCGLLPQDNIDLSDEDGSVKQLHYNLEDYATDYLRKGENLILLRVNNSSSEEELSVLSEDDVTYTPLLEGMTDNIEFLGMLNPSNRNKGKKSRGAPARRKGGMSPNSSSTNKKEKQKVK